MDSKKHRLYMVSFGDSRKYKLDYAGDAEIPGTIIEIERKLNAFLAERFPGENTTYYTTPNVKEVDRAYYHEVEQYPDLTSEALEEIKRVLVKEIEDMNVLKEQNRNAPFDD